MLLNDLQFIPGSMKKRKRVSRGNSGKATGRGGKGQKARTGVSISNFQGGQTPLERRFPKHNFMQKISNVQALPLSRLSGLFESKIIDEQTVLTRDLLEKLSLIKKGVKYKIIGFSDKKINIEAHYISEGAKNCLEANGGKYTPILIQKINTGDKE